MKGGIGTLIFIIIGLFSFTALASERHDLKCTLDSGKEMTVSHTKNSVYIGLKNPVSDSREESVFKLDILSGEIKQLLLIVDMDSLFMGYAESTRI
ncbi:hypothetical protein [uncultured Serratia sp.]|uniref:hypothetical protein n=1 Tax=uncultured Serratia sp. TaxID=239175 RepID=UPI00258F97DB|nr:hypothetical protein [uncultured Serratia sp.]